MFPINMNVALATFKIEATPPVGSPVAYACARKIEDSMSARGIILITADNPIVLCAVDAIGIANSGYDRWREALAEAAGTTIERVAVHTLHQHDGPRYDFETEELLAAHGCGGKYHDAAFAEEVIARAAEAVRQAVKDAKPVTHVGSGKAKVEKVASNRRIVVDGKVGAMRGSSCTNPDLIAAPEGVIDPWLRMITFWSGDDSIASLVYYATHPMSYYGKGDISPDFAGLARNQLQKETGVPHIYFTGAAGNIAAGKYNDGSPEMRPILTGRMADAMQRAWKDQRKQLISAADIEWRVEKVLLPLAGHMQESVIMAKMEKADSDDILKMFDAAKLVFLKRVKRGCTIDLTCLRLSRDIYILHMAGELFIEYQLAAQNMRPDSMVCMAAYGEYAPWYIGTSAAYEQGGYEVGEYGSLVAPEAEQLLTDTMRKLLK